jgi:hypothetical protein
LLPNPTHAPTRCEALNQPWMGRVVMKGSS